LPKILVKDDVLEIKNLEKFVKDHSQDVLVHYSEDNSYTSVFSEIARKFKPNSNIIFVRMKTAKSPTIEFFTGRGKERHAYEGPRRMNSLA
jgi:ABC-type methionine transport system ATPase subunit